MLTATSPICATVRGDRRAAIRGPEQREDEHRHRQRQQALAGLERVEAEHDLEVDGDDEERAHQDELLADQRREPGAQLRDAQQRRVEQLVAGRGGRGARSQPTNAASSASPPRTMNGTGEKPSGVISVPSIVGGVRGWTKPQTLLRRIARTIRPRPIDESADADEVELRPLLGAPAPAAIWPRRSRIAITTTVSAANT